MKTLTMIIMVAILLEAIVEYAKTIITMIEKKQYKTAITQLATIALGVTFAFIFNLQLFNNALSEFFEGLSINTKVDIVITGILFSRGANYFSDIISKFTGKKIPTAVGVLEGVAEELVEESEEFEERDDNR